MSIGNIQFNEYSLFDRSTLETLCPFLEYVKRFLFGHSEMLYNFGRSQKHIDFATVAKLDQKGENLLLPRLIHYFISESLHGVK